MMGNLQGVVMELEDCSLDLLQGKLSWERMNTLVNALMLVVYFFPMYLEVIPTDDPNVGFKDIDVAILVGSMPRREGMERKDLIKANTKIFETQGKALNKCAKKTVKVGTCGILAITSFCLHSCGCWQLLGFSCYFILNSSSSWRFLVVV